MVTSYITVAEGGSAQIAEKKSRFIADVFHVERETEVLEQLEKTKKQYWDARHHCYAYILGCGPAPQKRCSDDGEPSQTAGKPILEVLEGNGLCDTLIIVTRYFGGVLLGTGGLVRAYSQAAAAGVAASRLARRQLADRLRIETDYNGIGKILNLLRQQELTPEQCDYTDKVCVQIAVPVDRTERLRAEIIEITNGRADIEEVERCFVSE